jgi:Tyrosine-protein kinase ephrin type A/B receptor-like/Galactose oxidase, central domain/Kelch motif
MVGLMNMGLLVYYLSKFYFRFNPTVPDVTVVPYTGYIPALASPVVACNSNRLYVWGGYQILDGEVVYNTDLYSLDLYTLVWEKVTLTGAACPRLAAGLVYNNSLYIYTGKILNNLYSEITIIDLSTNVTTSINSNYSNIDYSYAGVSDCIYLFGGIGSTYSNLLSVFNASALLESTLSSEFAYPAARQYSCMGSILDNIYIFGGDAKSQILNDMWMFNTMTTSWTEVLNDQTVPSARFGSGCATEGSLLFVFGGQDRSYQNDLFVYSTVANTWSLMSSNSDTIPSGRSFACIGYYENYIYIYGGVNDYGPINELWSFNLKTSTYTLVTQSLYSLEYNTCNIEGSIFYIVSSNSTLKVLYAYDLYNQNWTQALIINNTGFGSSDFVLNGKIVSFGGALYESIAKKTVSVHDIVSNNVTTNDIPFGLYKAQHSYYMNYLYILGGSEIYGNTIVSGRASRDFMIIDMFQFYKENICSKGSYYNGTCIVCPRGTYSDSFSQTMCTECPAGSYNKLQGANSFQQCYLCGSGFWNNSTGEWYCKTCPFNMQCPYGSSVPIVPSLNPVAKSIQPSQYEQNTSEYNSLTIIVLVIATITNTIIVMALLVFKRLKENLYNLDLFTTKHNHKLMVPMYIKQTTLGGYCTILFIIISTVFIIASVLKFYMINITENRSMVPLITISDSSNIKSNLIFDVEFQYYGGLCGNNGKCLDSITVSMSGVDGVFSYNCTKVDKKCAIVIICYSCSIEVQGNVLINLAEQYSYCSQITLNATSTSSIPGEISSMSGYINSDPDYFFSGGNPSVFEYSLIPSIYIDGSIKKYGYHLGLESSTKGSESVSMDLFNSFQLILNIKLESNTNCLTITRGLSTGTLELFSALIGTVFGMMSSIGGILNLSEKYYERFITWLEHKNIISYYISRTNKILRVLNLHNSTMYRSVTKENLERNIVEKEYIDINTSYLF